MTNKYLVPWFMLCTPIGVYLAYNLAIHDTEAKLLSSCKVLAEVVIRDTKIICTTKEILRRKKHVQVTPTNGLI